MLEEPGKLLTITQENFKNGDAVYPRYLSLRQVVSLISSGDDLDYHLFDVLILCLPSLGTTSNLFKELKGIFFSALNHTSEDLRENIQMKVLICLQVWMESPCGTVDLSNKILMEDILELLESCIDHNLKDIALNIRNIIYKKHKKILSLQKFTESFHLEPTITPPPSQAYISENELTQQRSNDSENSHSTNHSSYSMNSGTTDKTTDIGLSIDDILPIASSLPSSMTAQDLLLNSSSQNEVILKCPLPNPKIRYHSPLTVSCTSDQETEHPSLSIGSEIDSSSLASHIDYQPSRRSIRPVPIHLPPPPPPPISTTADSTDTETEIGHHSNMIDCFPSTTSSSTASMTVLSNTYSLDGASSVVTSHGSNSGNSSDSEYNINSYQHRSNCNNNTASATAAITNASIVFGCKENKSNINDSNMDQPLIKNKTTRFKEDLRVATTTTTMATSYTTSSSVACHPTTDASSTTTTTTSTVHSLLTTIPTATAATARKSYLNRNGSSSSLTAIELTPSKQRSSGSSSTMMTMSYSNSLPLCLSRALTLKSPSLGLSTSSSTTSSTTSLVGQFDDLNKLKKESLLTRVSSGKLAEALTVIELRALFAIRPREFIHLAWANSTLKHIHPDLGGSLHINRAIEGANQRIAWLAREVVLMSTGSSSSSSSSKLIEYLIAVARAALNRGNFSTVFQIVSALDLPAVRLLKSSWAAVSPDKKALLKSYDQLCSTEINFGSYRLALSKRIVHNLPYIPCVQILLRDLTVLHSAGKWQYEQYVDMKKAVDTYAMIMSFLHAHETTTATTTTPTTTAYFSTPTNITYKHSPHKIHSQFSTDEDGMTTGTTTTTSSTSPLSPKSTICHLKKCRYKFIRSPDNLGREHSPMSAAKEALLQDETPEIYELELAHPTEIRHIPIGIQINTTTISTTGTAATSTPNSPTNDTTTTAIRTTPPLLPLQLTDESIISTSTSTSLSKSCSHGNMSPLKSPSPATSPIHISKQLSHTTIHNNIINTTTATNVNTMSASSFFATAFSNLGIKATKSNNTITTNDTIPPPPPPLHNRNSYDSRSMNRNINNNNNNVNNNNNNNNNFVNKNDSITVDKGSSSSNSSSSNLTKHVNISNILNSVRNTTNTNNYNNTTNNINESITTTTTTNNNTINRGATNTFADPFRVRAYTTTYVASKPSLLFNSSSISTAGISTTSSTSTTAAVPSTSSQVQKYVLPVNQLLHLTTNLTHEKSNFPLNTSVTPTVPYTTKHGTATTRSMSQDLHASHPMTVATVSGPPLCPQTPESSKIRNQAASSQQATALSAVTTPLSRFRGRRPSASASETSNSDSVRGAGADTVGTQPISATGHQDILKSPSPSTITTTTMTPLQTTPEPVSSTDPVAAAAALAHRRRRSHSNPDNSTLCNKVKNLENNNTNNNHSNSGSGSNIHTAFSASMSPESRITRKNVNSNPPPVAKYNRNYLKKTGLNITSLLMGEKLEGEEQEQKKGNNKLSTLYNQEDEDVEEEALYALTVDDMLITELKESYQNVNLDLTKLWEEAKLLTTHTTPSQHQYQYHHPHPQLHPHYPYQQHHQSQHQLPSSSSSSSSFSHYPFQPLHFDLGKPMLKS